MIDRIPLRDMARRVPVAGRGEPVTRAEVGVPVRAWIVDGRGRDVQVTGEAVAWTPRAVHVAYVDDDGRQGFVWVWASAVHRI